MNKKLVRFDWAIKKLLRHKANFGILEGFLSELFFEKNFQILEILESESNQQSADDKYNRFDILAKASNGELIIVEIQNSYEIDYFQRMIYGASKLISENLELGRPYSEVKKVISISIVYFNLGQGSDYIYKGETSFQGMHQNDLLDLSNSQKSVFEKEKVSDIFPEYYIIKVNNFNDFAKDHLDEWVYFLKNSEVKDDFSAKGLKQAGRVLDYTNLSKKDQENYNRHNKYLHDKASETFTLVEEAKYQERISLEEALYKQQIDIATVAIIDGQISDELIAKFSGLTLDKIDELKKSLLK